MYIGPQGIVHGTTITVLNAFRKINKNPKGKIFLTSNSSMSGNQPKAGNTNIQYVLRLTLKP